MEGEEEEIREREGERRIEREKNKETKNDKGKCGIIVNSIEPTAITTHKAKTEHNRAEHGHLTT